MVLIRNKGYNLQGTDDGKQRSDEQNDRQHGKNIGFAVFFHFCGKVTCQIVKKAVFGQILFRNVKQNIAVVDGVIMLGVFYFFDVRKIDFIKGSRFTVAADLHGEMIVKCFVAIGSFLFFCKGSFQCF